MVEAAILVIFPFVMLFTMWSDLLTMTIANRASILLVAGFLVLAPLTGMAWFDFGIHVGVALVMFLLTFALFAIGGMGGGDAKIITATSLWFGYNFVLVQYLIYASLLGGLLTLAILRYRGSSVAMVGNRFDFLNRISNEKGGRIPYGIALGAAGLMLFPQSPLGQWVLMN